MRLRNITGCREMIGESEFVVHEPETMKGKWREAFGNLMNYPHYFLLLFYWVFVFLPLMSKIMWVQTF